MRTTVMLDDNLLFEAREIASSQDLSLGEVISQLALRGLESPAPPVRRDGIPVFRRTPKSSVTLQAVLRAEDED